MFTTRIIFRGHCYEDEVVDLPFVPFVGMGLNVTTRAAKWVVEDVTYDCEACEFRCTVK